MGGGAEAYQPSRVGVARGNHLTNFNELRRMETAKRLAAEHSAPRHHPPVHFFSIPPMVPRPHHLHFLITASEFPDLHPLLNPLPPLIYSLSGSIHLDPLDPDSPATCLLILPSSGRSTLIIPGCTRVLSWNPSR